MKFFLIAGEASGDLHASHLMRALQMQCPDAEFRYFGGDQMRAVGGELLCHYRHLAYMGFVQVLLHLPAILRGMRRCKEEILRWKPDAVILIDYPGFNLGIARYVKKMRICPVVYYISPKIWAWKEHRIRAIRRDVDKLLSILPFEVDYFARRHGYDVTYVGNPTVDEVSAFVSHRGAPQSDGRTIALLPGSRRAEIRDNLSRMLRAVSVFDGYTPVIAAAPSVPRSFYAEVIRSAGIDERSVTLVEGQTYELLHHAAAALVTSGTATLETALFRVPQVVCYYMRMGWCVSKLRKWFLKVPYISLVNLVADREVVPELVADGMTVENVRRHLADILPGASGRAVMLQGYTDMMERLGTPGAPERAAAEIVALLHADKA